MKQISITVLTLACFFNEALLRAEGKAAFNCLRSAAELGGVQVCERGGTEVRVLVDGAEKQSTLEPSQPREALISADNAPVPPVPSPLRLEDGKIATGWKNGITAGFGWPFYAVLSPAIWLVSEGFGRDMSRHYDGARGDNVRGEVYSVSGVVLAAVLYVPALAVGVAGAVIGAVAGPIAEKINPGSTRKWDPDKI